MVRTYKPKGKGKSVSVGTRAWLATHQDGKTRLPPDRQTRYQIVGKTPSGKLKIEIVVGKDGFMEGIGNPTRTIPEEEWKLRFRMNPTDSKQVVRKRKKTNGGVVMKGGTGGRGKSGRTEKVKQGKAATKIQRAVRRKLKKVKAVRKEQVAREEKFAPGLREELGKTLPRRWEGGEFLEGTKALTETDLKRELRRREGKGRKEKERMTKEELKDLIDQKEWEAKYGEPLEDEWEKEEREEKEIERWVMEHAPPEYREWKKKEEAEIDRLEAPEVWFSMSDDDAAAELQKWKDENPEPRMDAPGGWQGPLYPSAYPPKSYPMGKILRLRAEEAIRRRAHAARRLAQPEPTYYRDLLRVDRLQQQPTYDYNRAAQDWRERGGTN